MGRKRLRYLPKVSEKMKQSLIETGYTEEEIELISNFGKRLKELRTVNYMTQNDLAKQLGVVTSAIGKYEIMPDSFPSVDILLKLSKCFNVSIDFLLKGTDFSSAVENRVDGTLNNSSFVQVNHGGIIMHSARLSSEASELLRIYDSFDGRHKLKLLKFAIELGEQDDEK